MSHTPPISRRALLGLLGVTAGATGLAACTPSGSPSGPTSTAPLAGDGDVTMWFWSGAIDTAIAEAVAQELDGVTVTLEEIGGADYPTKLQTVISGGAGIPDIAGVKGGVFGGDIAQYFPNEDRFHDLLEFGAAEVESNYVSWKWQQCISPDGKMIGFPMDIGPTALMYRADIADDAGLASDAAGVSVETAEWEGFFAWGEELQAANSEVRLLSNIGLVFNLALGQASELFFTTDNTYIGDGEAVRRAWDLAVAAKTRGLSADVGDFTPEWSAALAAGTVVAFPGASWLASGLKSNAPDTEGAWQLAPTPSGAANLGGSFLTVTADSTDPQAAFDVIRLLQSPENQAEAFRTQSLFPSSPGAHELLRDGAEDPFFAGQNTMEVFAASAASKKAAYVSPYDPSVLPALQTELLNVQNSDKDPEAAWTDAQETITRTLQQAGVL